MEYTTHTGRSGSERGGSDPAFPSIFVPISKSARLCQCDLALYTFFFRPSMRDIIPHSITSLALLLIYWRVRSEL